MVLAGSKGTPMREDPVPDEFVDNPLVLEDDLRHSCQVLVEQRDQLHGRSSFGQGGETADVAEEDREFALLARQVHIIDMFENVIHQLRSDVAVEGAASAAKLATSRGVAHRTTREIRKS